MTERMGRWVVSACAFAVALFFSMAAFGSEATVIRLRMANFFHVDDDHAWALVYNKSDKAFLFFTSDGGGNWTSFSAPFPLRQVFFRDGNTGWATAVERDGDMSRTFCVRTSDAGRTWEKAGSLGNSHDNPTGIAFDTNEHGLIVGEGYNGAAFAYETTDAGEHWRKLHWKTKPASGLYGVRVYEGTAFTWSAGAGGSGIFQLNPSTLPERISGLETVNFAFVSSGYLLSASQSTVHLRIRMDGNWQQVLKAANETFWDMKFVNAMHGCVAGGELYCTDDGGRSWEPRPLPRTKENQNEYTYRIYLFDALHGWAMGDGSIYQTNDGAHSWSKIDFFGVDDKPLGSTRRID